MIRREQWTTSAGHSDQPLPGTGAAGIAPRFPECRRNFLEQPMKRRIETILIVILLASCFCEPIDASCLASEPYLFLVRLEIRSCEPLSDYAKRTIDATPFTWLHMASHGLISRHPGVVLEATAVESLGVIRTPDGHSASGGAEVTEKPGRWFFAETDCEAIEGRDTMVVFQTFSCCDLIPPTDVPCFFHILAASPVPEDLQGLLE